VKADKTEDNPRRLRIEILPATAQRWKDMQQLFGPRGACDGCWCMWFRLPRSIYAQGRGDGNRRAMAAIVRSGEVPGLIAYVDGRPVGWVSVGPRDRYPVIGRSRTLQPIDDRPVWSIVCFFVARDFRGRGVTRSLLQGAQAYAREQGATIVEAYPVEPAKAKIAADAAYHGLATTFFAEGYREVARRSPTRPIVRKRFRRRPEEG
jgi:GNAT superfamily N-acetyltransferase